MSQSQSGVRLFLSESERRQQDVWIQDGSVWIQHGRIQDHCHHQIESEWMTNFFFVQNGWIQDGRIQDGCHHQVEWEWIGEVLFVQNGWIQGGRIHNGCHHQVYQIELVWIIVIVDWEYFWVNLREDNKVSEFKMAVSESKHGRIQDGCHHQVESEWMSEVFFVQMVGTNLGLCEWLWEEKLRWMNSRCPNSRWWNSRWLPSSSWVRMNEWSFFLCKWWEPILASVREFERKN